MKIKRGIVALSCVLAVSAAASLPATSQTGTAHPPEQISATLQRLSLTLPSDVMAREAVRRPLEELGREPCDQRAIVNLAKGLKDAGYRREAATAHVRFSETCNGHAPSLRAATNILLDLSDHSGAAAVASDAIKLEPFGDNGYYLRALAHDRGGSPKKAIEDYVTAIELFGAKDRIANAGYFSLARNYEKLGQFCDAVTAIDAWVAVNPARNDNSQTRAMISSYTSKGGCATTTTGNEDIFPVVRRNNVVTLPATINGVRGTFILDTGATFVSLKTSFAEKAKVEIDHDAVVRLNTANGIAEGKRGRAKTVQLRTIEAKDVAVVVQTDAKGTYGEGRDGLLGMSFLSRFHVTIDAKEVRIRARTGR